MSYSEENIKKIKEKYADVDYIYRQLMLKLSRVHSKLTNEKAREYLMQGVGRRLTIFTKSLQNIFRIFPVEKTYRLPKDDLTDLYINLHAFFVNISGILDNLGWIFVYENDLLGSPKEGKITKLGVGLFNKKTQVHLKAEFKAYIKSDRIQAWYKEYLKDYRDTLVHRIPLYVPPAALTKKEQDEFREMEKQLWNHGLKLWDYSSSEDFLKHDEMIEKQSQLGQACTLFAHSFNEGSKPVFLHAQILADFITIGDIINKYFVDF